MQKIDLWDQLHKNFGDDVRKQFFYQFFQIYGTDTQRKSCSSDCELSENAVDHVSILCLCGAINQTKNSKNAKILSTSRGHRNFFVGQKIFSFSLTCISKYQLLKDLFVTVGLLSVKQRETHTNKLSVSIKPIF